MTCTTMNDPAISVTLPQSLVQAKKVDEQTRQLEVEKRRFESEKEFWERRFNEVLTEVRAGRRSLDERASDTSES